MANVVLLVLVNSTDVAFAESRRLPVGGGAGCVVHNIIEHFRNNAERFAHIFIVRNLFFRCIMILRDTTA